MIILNTLLRSINQFFPLSFQARKLSNHFIVCFIHLNKQTIQMGNGQYCCDRNSQGGEFKKNASNKFAYTFQEDSVELSNTILTTSNFNNHSPPNEFSSREQCKPPNLSVYMKNQIDRITLASFASEITEHGERDMKYYRFKISGNIYQGEWKNNMPHGLGILYFQKGSVYMGCFIQGIPFVKGRIIMNSGAYYQGEIKYGKANGIGEFRDGDYAYRGYFKDDKKHGEGEQKDSQYRFQGIFQNGERVKGTYKYQNCIYKGEFVNDEFEGKGELQNEDKSVYNGAFREGKFHGYGVFNWADGSQYRGFYVNGQREGDGQFFNSKDSSISKGIWKKGVLKGQGEYKDYRGIVTKCIWDNGKMSGIKTK